MAWKLTKNKQGGSTAHTKLGKSGFFTAKFGKGVGVKDKDAVGFVSMKSPQGGKSSLTFYESKGPKFLRKKGKSFLTGGSGKK